MPPGEARQELRRGETQAPGQPQRVVRGQELVEVPAAVVEAADARRAGKPERLVRVERSRAPDGRLGTGGVFGSGAHVLRCARFWPRCQPESSRRRPLCTPAGPTFCGRSGRSRYLWPISRKAVRQGNPSVLQCQKSLTTPMTGDNVHLPQPIYPSDLMINSDSFGAFLIFSIPAGPRSGPVRYDDTATGHGTLRQKIKRRKGGAHPPRRIGSRSEFALSSTLPRNPF